MLLHSWIPFWLLGALSYLAVRAASRLLFLVVVVVVVVVAVVVAVAVAAVVVVWGLLLVLPLLLLLLAAAAAAVAVASSIPFATQLSWTSHHCRTNTVPMTNLLLYMINEVSSGFSLLPAVVKICSSCSRCCGSCRHTHTKL